MKLGKTIKNLRLKKGISQENLAVEAILPLPYLKLIEEGGKQPEGDIIKRIAGALNIPIPFLTFYAIDSNDVPEDKKELFELLHPHIKLLVDQILFPENPDKEEIKSK